MGDIYSVPWGIFFLFFQRCKSIQCAKLFFLHANSLILYLNEDKIFRSVFTFKISNILDSVLGIFTYNIVFYSSVSNLF